MIEQWLHRYGSSPQGLLNPQALLDIPIVNAAMEQPHRIPTAILLWYLRRTVPISLAVQSQVQSLLLEAGRRGHSFDGLINGKPLWAYVYQFRFVRVYSVLPQRSHPTAFMTVNLSGYLGTVIKLAYQVQVLNISIEDVIQQRQAHQNFQFVLNNLSSDNRSQLSIPDLMNAIQ